MLSFTHGFYSLGMLHMLSVAQSYVVLSNVSTIVKICVVSLIITQWYQTSLVSLSTCRSELAHKTKRIDSHIPIYGIGICGTLTCYNFNTLFGHRYYKLRVYSIYGTIEVIHLYTS